MVDLLYFITGSLSALIGVALGAFAVYRTKRDSYETFFTAGRSKGDSFNIDDDFEQVADTRIEMPEATKKANDAFVQQFAENLATRATK